MRKFYKTGKYIDRSSFYPVLNLSEEIVNVLENQGPGDSIVNTIEQIEKFAVECAVELEFSKNTISSEEIVQVAYDMSSELFTNTNVCSVCNSRSVCNLQYEECDSSFECRTTEEGRISDWFFSRILFLAKAD